jgi:hypothetical protein
MAENNPDETSLALITAPLAEAEHCLGYVEQDACQIKASGEAIFLPLGWKKLQYGQEAAFYAARAEYGSRREWTPLVEGPIHADATGLQEGRADGAEPS